MTEAQKNRIDSLSKNLSTRRAITSLNQRELKSLVYDHEVLTAKIAAQEKHLSVSFMEERKAAMELTDAAERFAVDEPGIY